MPNHDHHDPAPDRPGAPDPTPARQWAVAADRAEDDRLAETAAALPAVQAQLAGDPSAWPAPADPDVLDRHGIEQAANQVAYRLHHTRGNDPQRHTHIYIGVAGDPACRQADRATPARDDDRER